MSRGILLSPMKKPNVNVTGSYQDKTSTAQQQYFAVGPSVSDKAYCHPWPGQITSIAGE